MNNQEYLHLIEKYPNLTTHGFGVEIDRTSGMSYRATFDEAREELNQFYPGFEEACSWLAAQGTVNPGRAVCFWKGDLENHLSLMNKKIRVPRGVVMLAAIYLGYNLRRFYNSCGAKIGTKAKNRVRISRPPK